MGRLGCLARSGKVMCLLVRVGIASDCVFVKPKRSEVVGSVLGRVARMFATERKVELQWRAREKAEKRRKTESVKCFGGRGQRPRQGQSLQWGAKKQSMSAAS